MAKQYPHLQLCGYTLSKQQALRANNNINQVDLKDRITIYCRDSSIEAFPDQYDVVFGFEVAHHIKDKQALFSNIANHMISGAKLVLADFMSYALFPIEHEETNSYFSTQEEWIGILSNNHLKLIECINVSKEIVNFLYDPDFDKNFKKVENSHVREAFQSYYQLQKVLSQSMAGYVLLIIAKRDDVSLQELYQHNRGVLSYPIPYKEVADINRWFYTINWERKEALQVIPNLVSRFDTWLILANSPTDTLAIDLRNKLVNYSIRIIFLYPVETYIEQDENHYGINPNLKSDWVRFFNRALTRTTISQIIDLWSVKHFEDEFSVKDLFTQFEQRCLQILYLSQTLIQTSFTKEIKVLFVTRGVQCISELDTNISLEQSAVAALANVWRLENSLFCCKTVDLGSHLDEKVAGEMIIKELFIQAEDVQVALRQEGRQVASLRRLTLEGSNCQTNRVFRSDATCLISGGVGGLGISILQWYIEKGVRHFLLLGRNQPSNTVRTKLDKLKQQGITIQFVSADVADPIKLTQVLQDAKQHLPIIRYIVHAAGVLEDAAILSQDEESFRHVLLPKVLGAWNLHILTQGLPLEHFVFFSSIASSLGSPGQMNYAAANAFLDSLAFHRTQKGLPALSINWGTWGEIGMAAHAASKEQIARLKMGIYDISIPQGLAAMERALQSEKTNITIAAINWECYNSLQVNNPLTTKLTEVSQSNISTTLKPLTSPVQKASQLITCHLPDTFFMVRSMVAQITGIDLNEIDDKANFAQMGVDSVMAIQFRNRIQIELGEHHKVPANIIFDYPTINKLAAYIANCLKISESLPILKEDLPNIKQKYEEETNTAFDPVNKMNSDTTSYGQDIAIIGVSGQFPGAHDLDSFWENLSQGKSSIIEIPADRWSIEEFYNADPNKLNKSYSKWGGFLENIGEFDPLFFKISPLEAEMMDPQQRLFLQEAWKAFEDAGYSEISLDETKCGVYVGLSGNEYQEMLISRGIMSAQQMLGNANAMLAARIAYYLNLRGPAVVVDTACSSSLVALHLACKALQGKEADMMLAGGIALYLGEKPYIMMSRISMLSPHGQCKTFDQEADGIVVGEGIGIVLLKRLEDAIRDRDHIYGVIKGSGINQDGNTNGITAPNVKAQTALELEVYQRFNINPANISYIEAHGTGTKLGDPIEVQALSAAFDAYTKTRNYCAIGSVKTNIGHTTAAAGIIGLIKVLLCLQHKKLVPSLNFNQANEYIDFENSPFYVNTEIKNWKSLKDRPRLAAISSFGFSGTNTHVVIEEWPQSRLPIESVKPYYLLTLSAKHPQSLQQRIEDLLAWLKTHSETSLDDISYTLNIGRSHFNHRCALVVSSLEELQEVLEQVQKDQNPKHYFKGDVSKKDEDKAIFCKVLQFTLEELKVLNLNDVQTYQSCLETLANLYVKGYEFDWKLLYQGEILQKISLPTYPFLRKKYWFSDHLQLLPVESERIVNKTSLTLRPLVEVEKKSIVDVFSIHQASEQNKSSNLYIETNQQEINKQANVFGMKNRLSLKELKESLKEILKALLYLDGEVSEESVFNNFGMDSILGVEFIKKINVCFDVSLTASKLYDFPTIKDLATHLIEVLSTQDICLGLVPASTSKETNYGNMYEKTEKIILTKMDVKEDCNQSERKSIPINVNKENFVFEMGKNSDIAIVGMAACLPKAKNVQILWENLKAGNVAITEIPPERWSLEQHYSADITNKNKSYSKWGGFVEEINQFDSEFFNISPAEAEWMDPQQRLFLQVGWQALEDAGCVQSLDGSRCGIYVGVMNNDYQELLTRANMPTPPGHNMVGNANSILAARLAYFLNLKGPALTIDTACSSSLVATHLACQSLKRNETDLMLVGGVTLYLTETPYIEMCKVDMLSKNGLCKTFDNKADGFVPGEGCSVLVLKRLHDAIKEGDRIYGIIRGSGINQDGRTNGIMAPSTESQKALELAIYRENSINPKDITYVEAHGTGTKLGDPIEVEALTNAFREFTDKKQYCALGSIKSNIGHTSAAAGVASVIKVLLCMQHKKLVPTLHFKEPNEHINFTSSPFYVNTVLKDWEQIENKTRLAAINSFGFSGTNAHIVIEEVPAYILSTQQNKPYYLLSLSAKHLDSLKQKVKDFYKYLQVHQDLPLEAIAYTLNVGRSHFNYRCALVVSSLQELQGKLAQVLENQVPDGYFNVSERQIPDNTSVSEPVLKNSLEKLKLIDIQEIIEYKKLLEILADLYIKGHNLDWNLLHRGEAHQKISLPTYPFLKERYWATDKMPNAAVERHSVSQASLVEEKETSKNAICLFVPHWEQQALKKYSNKLEGPILIFDENKFLGQQLKDKNPNLIILQVSFGKAYRAINQYQYQLAANNLNDYVRLFDHLEEKNLLPSNVVYYTQLSHLVDVENSRTIDEQLQKSYLPLFSISKVLIEKKRLEKLQVLFINEGDGELHSLFTEALSGFIKTLHLEYPKITYRIINNQAKKSMGFKGLLSEFYASDIEVLYDENHIRWVKNYKKMLPKISNSATTLLKKRGVYLITGGAGGLGLTFANYLAECYQARLILVGRSSLKLHQRSAIDKMKEKGAKVLYIRADVTKPEEVKKIVEVAKRKFTALNGVIHAAGIVKPALNFQKNWSEIVDVISPKVHGTIYLDYFTKDETLDFFVSFSSMAAVLGDVGLSDYAYGNSFLDAHIKARSKLSMQGKRFGKSLSIDWTLWQEGGMKIKKEEEERLKHLGFTPLDTREGLAIFTDLLQDDYLQVVVLAGDVEKITNRISKTNLIPENIKLIQVEPTGSETSLKGMYAYLSKEISRLLKIKLPNIHLKKHFIEYGMDSIQITALANQINRDYNIAIQPSAIFTYSNIESLSQYLLEESIPKLSLKSEMSREKTIGNSHLSNKNIDTTLTLRLFCFPYAGGNPWIFSHWSSFLSSNVIVHPIDYHFNQDGTAVRDIKTVKNIVQNLINRLPLDLPFALVGSCLGALVAYELAKELERQGKNNLLRHLFVISCSAPHLYPIAMEDTFKIIDNYRKESGAIEFGSKITPEEYIEKQINEINIEGPDIFLMTLEKIGFNSIDKLRTNKDLLATFLPRMVRDTSVAKSYSPSDPSLQPLSIPITVFDGKNDETIQRGFMNAWESYTEKDYKYNLFSGDHYIVHQFEEAILAQIKADIQSVFNKSKQIKGITKVLQKVEVL